MLIRDDLRDVAVSLDLARVTFNRIKLNFVWALGYNCLGIPVGAITRLGTRLLVRLANATLPTAT